MAGSTVTEVEGAMYIHVMCISLYMLYDIVDPSSIKTVCN